VLVPQCPLMALSGHLSRLRKCPLLGVKADITNFLQMAQDIHMNRMRFGVDQGRRGWLEAGDVINTRSLAQLRKLSKR